MLAEEAEFADRVFVVDNGRVSTPLHRSLLDALEMIEAASSADEETTRGWIEEIQAFFPGMEILSDKLSLGLSCHTGQGALGIGCSCRPKILQNTREKTNE